MLRVAPTICHQSVVACEAGVIDFDTLKEGLQYFLQDLLSFTLPGVVRWLAREIGRAEYVRILPSVARESFWATGLPFASFRPPLSSLTQAWPSAEDDGGRLGHVCVG